MAIKRSMKKTPMVPPFSSPRKVDSPIWEMIIRIKGESTHSTMPIVVITAYWGWKSACILMINDWREGLTIRLECFRNLYCSSLLLP